MTNKNQNQFSPSYNKENQPSLWGQTTISPFYQTLYQETYKEEAQGEEGKDAFFQEQQRLEVRIYQVQSPQQNLWILSPEIYWYINPVIKGLFLPKEFQKFPQVGLPNIFQETGRKLLVTPSFST